MYTNINELLFLQTEFQMDQQIIQTFKIQKQKYIKKFGRNALDNFQLDDECKNLFKNKFKFVGLQDELTAEQMKPGYYIINTDENNGSGIHWISLVITPKSVYIFDSFGRPSKQILKTLYKNLNEKKLKIIDSDPKQEQKGNSVICGHLCICFLICCKKYGVVKTVKLI